MRYGIGAKKITSVVRALVYCPQKWEIPLKEIPIGRKKHFREN